MRITDKLLQTTTRALAEVLAFHHPADTVLSHFFRQERSLGSHDRAFVAESVYAVLRRKRSVERLAGVSPRRLLLATLAKVQGLSLRQLEGAVTPAEAQWLAGLHGEAMGPPPTLAERTDLPDWLVERLLPVAGEAGLLELASSLNLPAPLDLRVNPLKSGREAVLARLNDEGLGAMAGPWSPLAVRLSGKPALQKHPLFLDGTIEVQDEGSQLLGFLVSPRRGELVVDFCAGAGGKTLLLGGLMRSTGRLYAYDVSEKRLAKLKPRAARAGLSNVHPVCLGSENDARLKRMVGKADRVLVDAPCSGLGTLRRNPDLKWRQTPEGLVELRSKQAAILASASRLVKPGGRLVYATCSLLPEENAEVVDAFLATHPEFHRLSAKEVLAGQGIAVDIGEDLQLLPQTHGTDGFYAAVLERA
ncbi:MAG: RsmB/NOP family class I SAM-dependent RNA methyltransferase [Rhodocyclaceae bacterium]|nr:RsmB/NOP family class I SAM-dependent RNA methyltransferase [Rhodocyclaceae bacterium]